MMRYIFKRGAGIFTKDGPHQVVSLGIWKMFGIAILWASTISYFNFYVMSWSFLLATKVFNLYLF